MSNRISLPNAGTVPVKMIGFSKIKEAERLKAAARDIINHDFALSIHLIRKEKAGEKPAIAS